jgi:hypothetical protein
MVPKGFLSLSLPPSLFRSELMTRKAFVGICEQWYLVSQAFSFFFFLLQRNTAPDAKRRSFFVNLPSHAALCLIE